MHIEAIASRIQQEFSGFAHSGAFALIKFIIGVYVVVLFIDLVLVLIKRGIGANIRYMKYGTDIPAELAVSRGKLLNKWRKIKQRLESRRESQHKIAIIEADKIIDELLSKMGYAGANMGERLDKMLPGEIENKDEIREAHEIRNRIIHDGKFHISQEEATEIIAKFERFINIFNI